MKKVENASKDARVNALIGFGKNSYTSIKSLAVKKNTIVKLTSKILDQKMLTFAKISLASFIYDMIDGFSFPVDTTRDLYSQNEIIKCLLYSVF